MRKCGFFLIRRLQFSLWSGYLGDQPARIEELQSADETNATFSHKNPSISSNSTRFLGSKLAIFPYFWALLPDPETTSLVAPQDGAVGEDDEFSYDDSRKFGFVKILGDEDFEEELATALTTREGQRCGRFFKKSGCLI